MYNKIRSIRSHRHVHCYTVLHRRISALTKKIPNIIQSRDRKITKMSKYRGNKQTWKPFANSKLFKKRIVIFKVFGMDIKEKKGCMCQTAEIARIYNDLLKVYSPANSIVIYIYVKNTHRFIDMVGILELLLRVHFVTVRSLSLRGTLILQCVIAIKG